MGSEMWKERIPLKEMSHAGQVNKTFIGLGRPIKNFQPCQSLMFLSLTEFDSRGIISFWQILKALTRVRNSKRSP